MRPLKKPSSDGNGIKSFVVSDPSGPVKFGTIYGTDNMTTNRYTKFYYKVAKPYTALVTPVVEPGALDLETDEGGVVSLTPPSVAQILGQFPEAQWSEDFDILYKDIDIYAKNMAIEKCLAYGDLLMYVTASEARQTILMVKNVFVRLFEAILDVYKAAKKLNVVATLEVLSDIWLEYRYGWRPFISEVESLHSALTRIRVDGVKSAYGKVQRPPLVSNPIDLGTVHVVSDGALFTYSGSFKPSKLSAKAGFNYLNTESSRNDDWLAILGLDLEALLTTAWDLIPFSFVVDMFLNVGSILQVQNSSEQVDSFNSWLTHQTEGTVTLKCEGITVGDDAQPEFDLKEYLFRYPRLKFMHPSTQQEATINETWESINKLNHFVCQDASPYYPSITETYTKPFNGFVISSEEFQRIDGKYNIPFPNFNVVDDRFVIEQIWRRDSRGYPYLYNKSAAHPVTGVTINVEYSPNINDFLRHFNVREMSNDEIVDFLFYMVGTLSPIEDQFYVDCRNGGNALYEQTKNMYSMPFYKRYGFEFLGWGQGKIIGDPGSRQWRKTTGTMGSLYFEQSTISKIPEELNHIKVPCTLTTRRLVDAFQHRLTVDVDLASAQYADLGALAVTLTSRFRN